jgi:hypothetical protein
MSEWQGSAEFIDHPLGRLRMRLDRWRTDGPRALICMCNASTADGERNDPTIRRCMELLPAEYAGFTVVNWSPYIASDPADLHAWRDRSARNHWPRYRDICDDNYTLIGRLAETAPVRIVAWGRLVQQCVQTVVTLSELSRHGGHDLHAFGLTKDGAPKHPMARGTHRIANGSPLVVWRAKAQGVA